MSTSISQADILVRGLWSLQIAVSNLHINTRSGFAHIATKNFYKHIDDLRDRFSEYLIGQGKIAAVNVSIIEVSSDDLIRTSDDLCYQFEDFSRGDSALSNMAGEMKEAIANFKREMVYS